MSVTQTAIVDRLSNIIIISLSFRCSIGYLVAANARGFLLAQDWNRCSIGYLVAVVRIVVFNVLPQMFEH